MSKVLELPFSTIQTKNICNYIWIHPRIQPHLLFIHVYANIFISTAVLPLLGILPQIWGYRTHPKVLKDNFENPSKYWEIFYDCQVNYFFYYFGYIRRPNRVRSIFVLQIYNYCFSSLHLRLIILQTQTKVQENDRFKTRRGLSVSGATWAINCIIGCALPFNCTRK